MAAREHGLGSQGKTKALRVQEARKRCHLCRKAIDGTFVKDKHRLWHPDCILRYNRKRDKERCAKVKRTEDVESSPESSDEPSDKQHKKSKVVHELPKSLAAQLKDQREVLISSSPEVQPKRHKTRRNSERKPKIHNNVVATLQNLRAEFARMEELVQHELEHACASAYHEGVKELKEEVMASRQQLSRFKAQRSAMKEQIEDLLQINVKLDTERKHLCGEDVAELTVEQLDQLVKRLKKSLQLCQSAKDQKLKTELDRRRNEYTCKVCWSAESTMIVIPCGHLCLCDTCASKFDIGKPCPLCRQSIERVMKVYK